MRQRVAFLRTLLAGPPGAPARRAVRRARRDHARGPCRSGSPRRSRRSRAPCCWSPTTSRRRVFLADRSWCSRRGPGGSSPTSTVAPRPRPRSRHRRPAFAELKAARAGGARAHEALAIAAALVALFVLRLAGRRLARLGRRPHARLAGRDRRRACATTARCSPTTRGVTLVEVVLGLAIAVGGGRAAAPSPCTCCGRCATPPTRCWSASQAIPIVVLAPLFVLAFDYGIGPKLAIVALICFFPITVNLLDGLRSVAARAAQADAQHGRLAAARRCARSSCPSALPYLFSGLKVAATVSVIGAVFGEWAGADEGLGRLVLLGNNQLQTPRVYAGIVILTADGGRRCSRSWRWPSALAVPWNRKETPRMRRVAPAASLLLVAVLAGCGEKEDALEPSRLQARRADARLLPERRPRRHLRGAGGRALRAGRASTWRSASPPDPAAPIKQVAAGRVDLAISYEPEVLRARDQGLNVVSVGALVQEPLTSIISLPAREDRRSRRPQGQDGRHGRDRLPVRLPATRSSTRPACRRPRSRSATSASA